MSTTSSTEAKFQKWFQIKQQSGATFNHTLQNSPSFRNPLILEKLIEITQLNQYGTNYAKSVYDPDNFHPEAYYDALAETSKIRQGSGPRFQSPGHQYSEDVEPAISHGSGVMDKALHRAKQRSRKFADSQK